MLSGDGRMVMAGLRMRFQISAHTFKFSCASQSGTEKWNPAKEGQVPYASALWTI